MSILSSSLREVTWVEVGSEPDNLEEDVRVARSCALLMAVVSMRECNERTVQLTIQLTCAWL